MSRFNMLLRKYRPKDFETVCKLFFETVHSVNAKDYTKEQLSAWAPNAETLKYRFNDLLVQKTIVAETDGVITGFGSIDKNGCLDFLFVHKDYQGQGIATALCGELEKGFNSVSTFASVTAKPFFEHRGYTVVKEQEAERSGIKLKNYEMLMIRN